MTGEDFCQKTANEFCKICVKDKSFGGLLNNFISFPVLQSQFCYNVVKKTSNFEAVCTKFGIKIIYQVCITGTEDSKSTFCSFRPQC